MNKAAVKKFLDHPDKDEIISKLAIGISAKDICEWLKSKYPNQHETKYHLSEPNVKKLKEEFIDIYDVIKDDVLKVKQSSDIELNNQLNLAVKNSSAYKSAIIALAEEKVDVKKMLVNMIVAIESRTAQVFDKIQEDPEILKSDRILMEWFDRLGNMLEKYWKYVEQVPDQIIQHNVTVQAIDQHVNLFQDVIKEVLAEMDLEASMLFIEKFNQKFSKLKESQIQSNQSAANNELKLAEVKVLNEEINKKLVG